MKHFALAVIVLLTTYSAFALTIDEQKALESIASSWSLFKSTHTPTWSRTNFSEACNPPIKFLTCSSGPDPHVTALVIDNPLAEGFLGNAISGLKWLERLEVTKASLHGSIPSTIGELTSLKVLRLHARPLWTGKVMNFRRFMTDIPIGIANLTRLEELELRPSEMHGVFPHSLPLLSNLRVLSIASIDDLPLTLEGQLPDLWRYHQMLETLIIRDTSLSSFDGDHGSITSPLANLSILELNRNPALSFSISQLQIPAIKRVVIFDCPLLDGNIRFLEDAAHIEYLQLSGRGFRGVFPSPLIAPGLKTLILECPSVSGFIPDTVLGMYELEVLSIASPSFTGSLPSAIGQCRQLRTLELIGTRLLGPLPAEIGELPRLLVLRIARAPSLGQLPETLGNLPKLRILQVRSCGLTGTIPQNLGGPHRPQAFTQLDLSDNRLEGAIPDLACGQCRLSDNRLTGTIPVTLASGSTVLELQNNLLGPSLESDIFMRNRTSNIYLLDLSDNQFESTLPDISSGDPNQLGSEVEVYKFSNNRFFGDIPLQLRPFILHLDHNQLSGGLSAWLKTSMSHYLDVSHNNFTGAFPSKITQSLLHEAHFDFNQFSGSVPPPPADLTTWTLSHNKMDQPLTTGFIMGVQLSKSLVYLDLSHNQIRCPSDSIYPQELLNSTLRTLNLAWNNFSCVFHSATYAGSHLKSSPLTSLDLSHNDWKGPFTINPMVSLAILDISDNKFSGIFGLSATRFPTLVQLDISSNRLTFDAATITHMPLLHSVMAANNSIFGKLAPVDMPNLQTLDLDRNDLDVQPSLAAIGALFANQTLKFLSIRNNIYIPTFESLDTNVTGLARTSMSSQSTLTPGTVCYAVAFHNTNESAFLFDEDLFGYGQCDCDSKHFGLPAMSCHFCPQSSLPHGAEGGSIISCGGTSLVTAPNTFLFIPDEPNWGPLRRTENSQKNISRRGSLKDKHQALRFETESCLSLPGQLLVRKSACAGTKLTGEDLSPPSNAIDHMREQCAPGASGRLCSRCECDPELSAYHEGQCFYERALQCAKCKRILTSKESLGLLFGIIFLLIIFGTIGLLLVLRNRRVQKTVPWPQLSRPRKLFHRLLYLSSLGQVSILINFVQILLELTHWDAYAAINALQLMNLNAEGMGIRCLFPILAEPIAYLWFRLSVPFAAVALVAICVTLAEATSRILTRYIGRRVSRRAKLDVVTDTIQSDYDYTPIGYHSDSTSNEESWMTSHGSISHFDANPLENSDQWTPLAKLEDYESITVHYPTVALLTSVSIMAVKFFYFGTALTAHQYFFTEVQAHTGVRYMQNSPWLKESNALTEQWSSIPMAIIFDLVLPIAFLGLCYRLRNTFAKPSVAIYVGNLFESFTPKCFWWESINILKKLSIALVLRAFPATDALQSMLIVSIIAGLQILQMSLSPWKRRAENILDSISSGLLICALLAARSGNLVHSMTSSYYVAAGSSVYIVLSLALLVYETLTGKTEYEKRFERWSNQAIETFVDKAAASESAAETMDSSASEDDAGSLSFSSHSS